jgi:molecular chaperone DnaK
VGEVAIGIDLGTSTSCVGVMAGDQPRLLPNEAGAVVHASVVSFLEDGTVLVGNAAKQRLVTHPETTVASAKRLIGRYFFSEEVRKAREAVAYDIVEGLDHSVFIEMDGRRFSIPEISALVLREMKRIAELHTQREVTSAAVTVPAYFNDNQRQATRDAGRIAGLNVLRIINEPTAAALSYGFGRGLNQRVAVYDLGGGTFDISILEIGNDVFEVLSTAGDTYLGGDDIDMRIVDYLARGFEAQHGIDLKGHKPAYAALRALAEWGKQQLTVKPAIDLQMPNIFVDADRRRFDLSAKLDQGSLKNLTMDLIQRTFQVCDDALRSAELSADDLDGVILVGGPTRLPLIQQSVQHYFGKEIFSQINPEQVVAMGAALQANNLTNPGEHSMLLDVTPLTLKIEIAGGLTAPIIEKNTPVPIERTRVFTTVEDYQAKVKIRVMQGESKRADGCTLLGEFEFSGFRRGLHGDVAIEVTFEIDANGIVNVSARDPETGKTASQVIRLSGGLTDEQIEESRDGARDTQVTSVTHQD